MTKAAAPPAASTTRALRRAAAEAGEDLPRCLEFASRFGRTLPTVGGGQTWLRWQLLAAAGAGDLTAARVLEPHADALAIMAEASGAAVEAEGVWGVFAAEGPGVQLRADRASGGWLLNGRKAWCSLAAHLDHALVTAHTPAGRRLFAVDLRERGVVARPGHWVARGLRVVDSGPVDFDAVPATPVGGDNWYLQRPGFAWGGIGVAACWFGGALALAQTLRAALSRRPADPIRALSLGRVDTVLYAAERCLEDSAARIDRGTAVGDAGPLLAARVRAVVAAAAEQVVEQIGHALGPTPLAFDEEHARRVADLQIYLRQHHAERDLADIGALLLRDEASCRTETRGGPAGERAGGAPR